MTFSRCRRGSVFRPRRSLMGISEEAASAWMEVAASRTAMNWIFILLLEVKIVGCGVCV